MVLCSQNKEEMETMVRAASMRKEDELKLHCSRVIFRKGNPTNEHDLVRIAYILFTKYLIIQNSRIFQTILFARDNVQSSVLFSISRKLFDISSSANTLIFSRIKFRRPKPDPSSFSPKTVSLQTTQIHGQLVKFFHSSRSNGAPGISKDTLSSSCRTLTTWP